MKLIFGGQEIWCHPWLDIWFQTRLTWPSQHKIFYIFISFDKSYQSRSFLNHIVSMKLPSLCQYPSAASFQKISLNSSKFQSSRLSWANADWSVWSLCQKLKRIKEFPSFILNKLTEKLKLKYVRMRSLFQI